MQDLVLHTSLDTTLLRSVASGLLLQRQQLRRQGIGLRFTGFSSPKQQWEWLASAMTNKQKQAWLQAMWCWRFQPRDTWLCSENFHQSLLNKRTLIYWRDWFDSQKLRMIAVVHLLPPQQQSWRWFTRNILSLKHKDSFNRQTEEALFYNKFYNRLIEAAGVRGIRFVLHTQVEAVNQRAPWSVLLDDSASIASIVDQQFWPTQECEENLDLRAFVLSLELMQSLRQPVQDKDRSWWCKRVKAAAKLMEPISLAEAQQLASEAGWFRPKKPELSEDLEYFAQRVWGSPWPSQTHESVAGVPIEGNVAQQQFALKKEALASAARQILLDRSSI
jgi:hypothetical protein